MHILNAKNMINVNKREADQNVSMRECFQACLSPILFQEAFYFFNKTISNGLYDVIIIVANKCYNFYKLISRVLPPAPENLLIVSDDALPYISDKIMGLRIAIIDDVSVYGRTTSAIKNDLYLLKVASVTILSFIVGENPYKTNRSDLFAAKMTTEDWRYASSRIVCAFDILGQPNSFCGPMVQIETTADLNDWKLDDVKDFFGSNKIYELPSSFQELSQNFVYIPDNRMINSFKENDLCFYFVQINKLFQKKIRVVPYVIFEQLTSEEVSMCCEHIATLYTMRYDWGDADDGESLIRRFRFLQYIIRLSNCHELENLLSRKCKSITICHDDLLMGFGQKEYRAIDFAKYRGRTGALLKGVFNNESSQRLQPEYERVIKLEDNVEEFSYFRKFSLLFLSMKIQDEFDVISSARERRISFPLVWRMLALGGNTSRGITAWLFCMMNSIASIKAQLDGDRINLVSYAGEHSYFALEKYFPELSERLFSEQKNGHVSLDINDRRTFVSEIINGISTDCNVDEEFQKVLKWAIRAKNPSLFDGIYTFLTTIDSGNRSEILNDLIPLINILSI